MAQCRDDGHLDPELNQIDVCNLSVDDHLELIQRNLPRGRAWSRGSGTTLTAYWRSFAEAMKFFEDRVCDLLEEFFCDSVDETLDIWAQQYGIEITQVDLTDPCVKPGLTEQELKDYYASLICGRVAATGGATCDYYQSVAASMNWTIDCNDTSAEPVPVTGCMIVGCTRLGPPDQYIGANNLGWEDLNPCDSIEEAVTHPNPEAWQALTGWPQGSGVYVAREGVCPVPGTNLGHAVVGPGDCYIAGYYTLTDPDEVSSTNPCVTTETLDDLKVDIENTIFFPTPPLGPNDARTDTTGQFAEYIGHAYTITIQIDVAASMTAKDAASPFISNYTVAGCMVAGNTCCPLNKYDAEEREFRAYIESLVPAHVQVAWERI